MDNRKRNWQHRCTKDEEKQNKNTTQYVLDTTMRKNTNNVNKTWASYKQLEVKINRTSFFSLEFFIAHQCIYEGWHWTRMWKTLEWFAWFHNPILTTATVIEVHVPTKGKWAVMYLSRRDTYFDFVRFSY